MRKAGKAVGSKGSVKEIVPLARVEEMMTRGEVDDALFHVVSNGISPNSIPAMRMRAMVLLRKGRLDEAEFMLKEIVKRAPDQLSWKMMGDWHFLKLNYEGAQSCYSKALEINPYAADIVHDYGVALHQFGKYEEGLTYFRKAVALAPDRADFKHHLSLILLTGGHDEEGWKLMDARMDVQGICGTFPNPERYWKGQDLTGKTLVLRREQGIGDTVQFARYIPPLLEKGLKKLYFFITKDMVPWAQNRFANEPRVVVWPDHAPPPLDFDYHVNIMSLPQHFPGEYFTRHAAPNHKGEGVGFCWFGSPTHKADHLRSIPIEKFEPIFNTGIPEKFYCVAYGRFEQQPPFVHYLIDDCWDFGMTAEKIKKLRLIITVDTAVAHIAGDLGIPVWVLLPKIPDFRWRFRGARTPWYESMRLYRQEKLFDWEAPIERIAEDLKAFYGIKDERELAISV